LTKERLPYIKKKASHATRLLNARIARVLLVAHTGDFRCRLWAKSKLHIVGNAEHEAEALNMARGLQPDIIILAIDSVGSDALARIGQLLTVCPFSQIVLCRMRLCRRFPFASSQTCSYGFLVKSLSVQSLCAHDEPPLRLKPMNELKRRRKIHSISDFTGIYDRVGDYATPYPGESPDRYSSLWGEPKQFRLSDREKEIVELLVNGLILKEVATELRVSWNTINAHVNNIYHKLNVHTRGGLVAKALRENLI
jgi:DNA-binding NarL/FixJ family response regulator